MPNSLNLFNLAGTDYTPLPPAGYEPADEDELWPAPCACRQCQCGQPLDVDGDLCDNCQTGCHVIGEPAQPTPPAPRGFRALPRVKQLLVLGKYAELNTTACYDRWRWRGRTWQRAYAMYRLEDFICGG